MAGKLPISQKIKRSRFRTEEEFLAALEKAGRHREAEAHRIRKGMQ